MRAPLEPVKRWVRYVLPPVLYAAGIFSHNVLKRTPAGQITQIVGPSGDGKHPLTSPFAIAVAGDGTTYVGGRDSNHVLRVDPETEREGLDFTLHGETVQ